MSKELKPCLKCNGKVNVDTGGFGPVGEDETIKVTFFDCADCGLTFSIPKPRVQAIKEFNTRPDQWDLKEWPCQTHLRAKTMEKHLEQIQTMFGDKLDSPLQQQNRELILENDRLKLSPWIKITPTTRLDTEKRFIARHIGGAVILGFFEKKRWYADGFTHYMPIPPIPEKG